MLALLKALCCSGSPTVHRRGSELEGMGRNESAFQDAELTRERNEQLLIDRLSYRGCRPVAISGYRCYRPIAGIGKRC
jgi:hypothetical protein